MEADFVIKTIQFNTPEYQKAVELRRQILRIPLGLDFDKTQLASEFRDYHIVAIKDDEIIGCLILTNLDGQIMKMRQVAVHLDFQNKHIGKQMVSFAEEFARKKKFHFFTLNSRETVISFYEKLGYQTIGDFFIEVNIPHKKMYKKL